jgi:hypothetical protein
MPVICKYGQHEVSGVECRGSLYCYSDPKNGIERDISICGACLLGHVRRHYPGCATERHLLSLHPELQVPLFAEDPPEHVNCKCVQASTT